jgi:hypothetical protein
MLRKSTAIVAMFAALSLTACVAEHATPASEEDLSTQLHQALSSSSTPKGIVPLYAEAVYLPERRAAIVDLALTAIPQPPTEADEIPLHSSGEFDVVMIYIVHADGSREVSEVLSRPDLRAPRAIGPGGGCIHFLVPARVGDRLLLGAIVRTAGEKRARIGVAPTVTVVNQIPGSGPNQWPFEPLGDHNIK